MHISSHFGVIVGNLQWEFDPTGKFLSKGHNDCIVVLLESHKGRNRRQTRKRERTKFLLGSSLFSK